MTDREKSIRIALLKAGITNKDLAKKHKVTHVAITRVIQGETKSARIEKDIQEIVEKWSEVAS
jgi:predicted transcriptional regulator